MASVAVTASAAGRGTPKASSANTNRVFDPTKLLWVTAVTRFNPNTLVEETSLYATRPNFTAWSALGSSAATIRLLQPADASRTAFNDHATTGRSRITLGDVQIQNPGGILDVYRNYPVDGRRLAVYLGMDNDDFPSGFSVVYDGTMSQELIGQDVSTISLRDWQRAASVPIQTTKFAGTNVLPAGLEGTSDIGGKPKPVCFGSCRNVPLICVNTSKLIFQVHDGQLAAIDTVYDSGIPLTNRLWLIGGGDGAAGYIYTAPDGGSWQSRTNTFGANNVRCFAVGAGLIVAVGGRASTSSKIQTSPDGVTWTNRTSPFGSTEIRAVAWNGSTFIAGDDTGQIATSSDGITWTLQTSGIGTPIKSIVWNGSVFIIEAGNILRTTPTGAPGSYTTRTSGFGATTTYALAYASSLGLSVLVGDSGKIASSPDGVTWTLQTSPDSSCLFTSVAFGNGVFVAFDLNAGKIARSIDGVTWSIQSAIRGSIGTTGYSLGFGNGQFTLVGSGGNAFMSTDGVLWSVAGGYGVFGSVNLYPAIYLDLSALSTYGTTTDLQDDSQAPSPGLFKVLLSTSGSYVRLGSTPRGKVTADVVQGSNTAARTAAQLATVVLQRAGFSAAAGDWSTSDVTALDALNSAVCGYFTDSGDTATCADALDQLLGSIGAGWWADKNGVIRFGRLSATDSLNLIASPSSLADSPWIGANGLVASNAVALADGLSFCRISGGGGGTGQYLQHVTLTGSGKKKLGFALKSDGHAGTAKISLFDNTAPGTIADVVATFTTSGVTVSLLAGDSIRSTTLPDGGVLVEVVTNPVTNGHAHDLFLSDEFSFGSGWVSSFLATNVHLYDATPTQLVSLNGTSGVITDLVPAASADANGGLPCTKTTIRYSKNFQPMAGGDLALGVSDASRVLFGTQFLESATTTDATVVTAHPLSIERIDDTLLTSGGDAATEATRRQALFGAQRHWYDVTCIMTSATAAIELGDVIELVTDRFGFGAGVRAVVLGIAPNAQAGTITFQCWL